MMSVLALRGLSFSRLSRLLLIFRTFPARSLCLSRFYNKALLYSSFVVGMWQALQLSNLLGTT